jgi:hypothetical protein
VPEDLVIVQSWQVDGCTVTLAVPQHDLDAAKETGQIMNTPAMLRIVKRPPGDQTDEAIAARERTRQRLEGK